MWILLIEDEDRLRASLAQGLREEGYVVDGAADGEAGLENALAGGYDALVVDWRLPHRDGPSVIEALREAGRETPALMLTVMSETRYKVAGLDAGADDYLAKPFDFEELLARLRALRRRPPLSGGERVLESGALTVDTERGRVTLGGTLVNLRPKEYALLEVLLRRTGDVVSRAALAERVWGETYHVSDNAFDVTLSGLRRKLEDARKTRVDASDADAEAAPPQIETVRGAGYRLTLPSSS
jgi:two-component system OmpR family response regulator